MLSQRNHLTLPTGCIYGLIWFSEETAIIFRNVINPFFFISCGGTAPLGPRPPHCWGFEITLRHTTLARTPLDEGSVRLKALYLTTHNTDKRHIHAPGGIRTIQSSNGAAADLRLRRRGHQDRLISWLVLEIKIRYVCGVGGDQLQA
jgi:hypothetical protein